MKNIFVPDIEVCQTLIKKFLGGEGGEKYTINVFVLNKEEAIEIINATGTIVTPVQHLNHPGYKNDIVEETIKLEDIKYRGEWGNQFINTSKAYFELGYKKPNPYSWYANDNNGKLAAILTWDSEALEDAISGETDKDLISVVPYKQHGKSFIDAHSSVGVGTILETIRATYDTVKKTAINIRLDRAFKLKITSISDLGNGSWEIKYEKIFAVKLNDGTKTPLKMSKGDRIKQLNGLRVQNLKKAVGKQFTATRSGISATFTVTPELIYLGEDGDVYTTPSGAILSIWEKKGYPGVLTVNGWAEAVNKDGKSLDEVLEVSSHG